MNNDAHALIIVEGRRREIPIEDIALYLAAVSHPETQPTAAVLEQVVGERDPASTAFDDLQVRRRAYVPALEEIVANNGTYVGRASATDQDITDVCMVTRVIHRAEKIIQREKTTLLCMFHILLLFC